MRSHEARRRQTTCGPSPATRSARSSENATVLSQMIRSSDLLGFVTDVAEGRHGDERRVRIPIQDADAHATFYVVALLDAPRAVLDIVEELRR